MKRLVILIAAMALAAMAAGQTTTVSGSKLRGWITYTGFSGGMMFHTGYVGGGRAEIVDDGGQTLFTRNVAGVPTGVGGAARVHFGNHLRIGGEGYVSTLKYGPEGSNMRAGWGGALVDCAWQVGRWVPYGGVTLGGGVVRNLTLQHPAPLDYTAERGASYRRYGFMLVAPFVGVEYALTGRIHLNMKVDWMVNLTNRQRDFATGPRVYIGFSFWRLRD